VPEVFQDLNGITRLGGTLSGDGTQTFRTSPVQVALPGPAVGVGAGDGHSLAVVGDCASGPGDAWAWGANSGQLGDGSTMGRNTPVQVHGPLNMGFLDGVAKMVGGAGHTVALMCNGDVLAWGANNSGQLGTGNMAAGLVPAPVVVPCVSPPRPLLGCPLTNVVDVAAGAFHSLAVDANGDVWAWGNNAFGQLCNAGTSDLVFATKVFGGALTSAPAGVPLDVVAGGATFSLVLLANQTLVGCGLNNNGQLGDWGIHWMDQILWWTEETHPKSVYSTAGRFVRQDSTDAPDTQIVAYEFETFSATWEQRHYAGHNAEQHLIGAYFYGTEGTYHMGWRDGWTFYPVKKGEKVIHVEPQLNDPDGQNIKELWADFLDAIRSKRRAVRDIEIGYRATAAALLGMVSWRLGRSVRWDGKNCPGDAAANKLLRRAYRKPWKHPAA
jgi:hypothetical protein